MAPAEEKHGGDSTGAGPLPGEPIPAGQLDPELIALPRAKTRVGPLLSLAVTVLSVFLLLKLWPDFRFSLADEPDSFPDVGQLLASSPGGDAYVSVRLVPDLTVGAVVRKSKGSYGHRIRPVLGSSGKVWVMSHSYHWHATPAYNLVYQGRWTTLGDLPFFDQLTDGWKGQLAARRVVVPEKLQKALTAKTNAIEPIDIPMIPNASTSRSFGRTRLLLWRQSRQWLRSS